MNPFEKNKNPINLAEHIRDAFIDKKAGDTFELDMKGFHKNSVRATIFMTVKQKYKTKIVNGKMYVLMLDGDRTKKNA